MKNILIIIFVGIAVTCMAAYSIRTMGKSSSLHDFNAELLAEMWDEPADTDTIVPDSTDTSEEPWELPDEDEDKDKNYPCCYTCKGRYCGVYIPLGDTIPHPVYYALED